MELRQLEVFVSVVDLGSFTKAADKLMVAQPSISQSIKALEDSLGVVLMKRDRGGITLTPAGELLMVSARAILREAEQGARRAKRASLGLIGSLRIGFLGSATAPFLPDLIASYRAAFPDVGLELRELTPTQQVKAFLEGSIDVGCNRPLPESLTGQFVTKTIYTDRLMAAVPRGHPYADRDSLSPEDFRGQSLVLFSQEEAPELRRAMTSYLTPESGVLEIVSEPHLMPTVLLMVASGVGLSLAPGCVRHLRQPGVAFVPLSGDPPPIPLQIAYRKESTCPLVKNWVHMLEERRATIRTLMESG